MDNCISVAIADTIGSKCRRIRVRRSSIGFTKLPLDWFHVGRNSNQNPSRNQGCLASEALQPLRGSISSRTMESADALRSQMNWETATRLVRNGYDLTSLIPLRGRISQRIARSLRRINSDKSLTRDDQNV